MTPLAFGADLADRPFVADTSVIISLNATGCVTEILGQLHAPMFVPRTVLEELEQGRSKGWRDIDKLHDLVAEGCVEIMELQNQGLQHFEALVIGAGPSTLDDGEAATIACALQISATAVIDERKANRICAEKYPGLAVASTLDLLRHDNVICALGIDRIREAVLSAWKGARMRIPSQHKDWFDTLIGGEACHRR